MESQEVKKIKKVKVEFEFIVKYVFKERFIKEWAIKFRLITNGFFS